MRVNKKVDDGFCLLLVEDPVRRPRTTQSAAYVCVHLECVYFHSHHFLLSPLATFAILLTRGSNKLRLRKYMCLMAVSKRAKWNFRAHYESHSTHVGGRSLLRQSIFITRRTPCHQSHCAMFRFFRIHGSNYQNINL